jgi:heat-inducible transcriptional repressor
MECQGRTLRHKGPDRPAIAGTTLKGTTRPMLSDRRRIVLSALVEEYVRSAQPVASKQLVDNYDLRVSPATVRSELAALEEIGYVLQPHVSAGRVPTDSGYRAFVDSLLASGRSTGLTPDEVEAVHGQYVTLEHEVAEAMRETSALLSRLTNYVAVVIAPTLRRARIRRINLVWIAEARAVVVVITDSGQVADRTVDLVRPVTIDQVASAERVLNASLEGTVCDEVRDSRAALENVGQLPGRVAAQLIDEVIDCLVEADRARVVTGGVSAVLAQPEFADPRLVGSLLHLLEDGLATLEVLTEVMEAGEVAVRIGAENRVGLDRLSVVATNYDAAGTAGVVGVIGPTRMDYPRAVSAVRTVADGLSEALG